MADWENSKIAHVQSSLTLRDFGRLEAIARGRDMTVSALVREIVLAYLREGGN